MLTVVVRAEGGRRSGTPVERLGEMPTVAVIDIAPVGDLFVGAVSGTRSCRC
jgi:hypothetical protein